MYKVSYNASASVCALLLLGSACARQESSGAEPQQVERAQDAGESFDAGAVSTAAAERFPSADAGIRSSAADAGTADAGAEPPDEQASAGSGAESKSTRAGSGGGGGATARSKGRAGSPAGGAGGTAASPRAEAGGGASETRGEAGSEAGRSAGGSRAEAGSNSEGAAGEPGEPDEEGEEPEGDEAAGSGGAGGAPSGSDEPSDCAQIRTACAAVTSPSADVTSCLSVGEAAGESACRARIEDCRQTCGAPLCEQVLDACPASDAGPVQGCHQIGVKDDASDCFGDGVSCIDYCREVEAMTP